VSSTDPSGRAAPPPGLLQPNTEAPASGGGGADNPQSSGDTGGAPPPPDFTTGAPPGGTKLVDPEVSAGERLYFQIWGTKPPKGYIEGLVKAGLNIFEIQAHELSKPGAKRTQYYQGKFADYAATLAQAMGFR